MKKIYPVILVFVFLLFHQAPFAQCSLSAKIETEQNTTQLDCNNDSIFLFASEYSDSVMYSWNTNKNDTLQGVEVGSPGTYILTVTSRNNATCTASDTIQITRYSVSILAIPGAVCGGSPSTLVATGAATYQWQQGSPSNKDTIIVAPVVTTTYSVTGTAADGCTSTATFTLDVNPSPNASISSTKLTSCQFDTADALPKITFTGFGGKPPYTFAFTVNGSPVTQTISTQGSNSSIMINVPTGQLGSFSYKLFSVSDGNGCTRAIQSQPVVVTIVPKPVLISNQSPYGVCNNSVFSYKAQSSVPGTTFSWTSGPVTGVSGNTRQGSDSVIYDRLSNNTSGTPTVKYNFTLSVGQGCGNKQTVTVAVSPTPTFTSTKDTIICSGPFNYLDTTSATGPTWTSAPVPGISGNTPQGSNNISDILINNTLDTLSVKYIYTLSVGLSCLTKETVKVTVNPAPIIDKLSDAPYCNGDIVSNGIKFSSHLPTASFTWISDKNIGFGTGGKDSIPKFMAINTGTDTIVATVTVSSTVSSIDGITKCSGAPVTFKVTVYPTPNLTSSKADTACSGLPFTYTATSSAARTSFSWTRPFVPGISGNGKNGSGAVINDTLINTTSQVVPVTYKDTLSVSNGCSKTDSVTVAVYPTPNLASRKTDTVCSGSPFTYTAISSVSAPLITSFSWTRDNVTGISNAANQGSTAMINETLINTTSIPVVVNYVFTLSVGKNCSKTDTVMVTVNPAPTINPISPFNTFCNGDSARNGILFSSPSPKPSFTWISTTDVGFSTGGKDSIPKFMAIDTGIAPVVDTVTVNITDNSTKCSGSSSTFIVTVNPTPKINLISDTTFCNGDIASGILFSSPFPDSSFTWKSTTNVGFDTSGKDSIPKFMAKNTGTDPVVATVSVTVITSLATCPSQNSAFTVTVYPAPPKPGFTSFSDTAVRSTLSLCKSSENINFNVISPQPASSGISYHWTSTVDTPNVIIKDTSHPNTVITFNSSGPATISVTANYQNAACASSASQVVTVTGDNSISTSKEKKIFIKQPGNLLIYPDNSIDSYQWGYDSVSFVPDMAASAAIALPGQVYQFFTPDSRFIKNGSLDTTNFYYWVLLHNKGCDTKVYYNGPYDDKPDSIRLSNPSNTIQLQIIPNPNKGMFDIGLQGNIYGNIEAQVYNSAGQLVYRKNFVKTIPDVNETFITNGLPAGVYFLILRSSDLKQVRSRFIISH